MLIVGGGVAGLETLLALQALASSHVDITILSPELRFLNRPMSVAQPFEPKRLRGLGLERIAEELDVHWHRGTLDRVEHEQRRAVTRANESLPYEMLVLAVGAHPEHEFAHALTYRDGRDASAYRLLLQRLHEERVRHLAFVKPRGMSWPLPLYDLALMTAAHCAEHAHSVELSLVTPEDAPLGLFGATASAAVGHLLQESGVTVYTSSLGIPTRPGWLDITPGDRGMHADRVVSQPQLAGPRLRGVPCDHHGFIATDSHGRIPGFEGAFAAGDATAFPVKHSGLATQQADAVAEAISASVGVEIKPEPFHPVLRGLLLTGKLPRYLRADISDTIDEDSTISSRPLWWPPDKIAGRYLGPYLSAHVEDGAAVHVPQETDAVQVETALDHLVDRSSHAQGAGWPQPPRNN